MSFYIKRRDRIILTAIDIINELGFQGMSTKEICKRQEISEGALYKHFRSKDEVILGVLDFYQKFDSDIKQTIELKGLSSKESISFFVTRYGEYYENYPAMTAILNSYEILKNEKAVSHRVIEIFESRFAFIKSLIDKGLQNKEFKVNIDSENFSDVIIGSCNSVTLKWRMRNYSFPLKERLLSTLEIVLQSY